MVFTSAAAAETALVLPANFEAHLGDFTNALNYDEDIYRMAPGLDWLQSAMPDEHDLLERLSPSQFDQDQWDEVLLAQSIEAEFSTTNSGLSSPVDSPSFDVDDLFDASCSSSPSTPIKRKASHDSLDSEDDDDFISAKKAKVKKAGLVKTRRVHDEATARTIAVLRTECSDNPESRRKIHNVLERKRRNDLKSSYQELRESLPELETADRAPTGQILGKAVEFIAELQEEEKRVLAAIAALRAENDRLRASLSA
jgi:Myc proto-oncogene protein